MQTRMNAKLHAVHTTMIKCCEVIQGCFWKINLQSEHLMVVFIDWEAGVRDA